MPIPKKKHKFLEIANELCKNCNLPEGSVALGGKKRPVFYILTQDMTEHEITELQGKHSELKALVASVRGKVVLCDTNPQELEKRDVARRRGRHKRWKRKQAQRAREKNAGKQEKSEMA